VTKNSFQSLPLSRPDPIFAIAAEAKAAGPGVLDATIGVLLGDDGKPVILESVLQAMEKVTKDFTKNDFTYPVLAGLPAYREVAERLIFGEAQPSVASIATTGGTGALSLNLRLARRMGIERAILLTPSWVNHKNMIEAAGLTLTEVSYLDEDLLPTTEPLIVAAKAMPGPTLIILQSGCHNPTGRDFSAAQWKEITDALSSLSHIILLDLAYQGWAEGIAGDRLALGLIMKSKIPVLLAWSASKNHGLYSFRTGLAVAVLESEKERVSVEQHYASLSRTLYSGAPTMGQMIVIEVQKNTGAWEKELDTAREILDTRRKLLTSLLPDEWKPLLAGHGMFTQLPLSSDQLQTLKKQKVFLTPDGRINISGIPTEKIELFARHLTSVL
jgi:aspartate/tyrosine/aromatic aminotransferase